MGSFLSFDWGSFKNYFINNFLLAFVRQVFDILDYPLSFFLLSQIIRGYHLWAFCFISKRFLYIYLPVILLKFLNISVLRLISCFTLFS